MRLYDWLFWLYRRVPYESRRAGVLWWALRKVDGDAPRREKTRG